MNAARPQRQPNFKVAYLSFGLAFLIQFGYIVAHIKDISHEVKLNADHIQSTNLLALENKQEHKARQPHGYQIVHIKEQLSKMESHLSAIAKGYKEKK